MTDPHEPLPGQLRVVVERLTPPVADNVRVVGVCPLLVNETDPDAAVGVVVVAEIDPALAEMLGGVRTVKLTGTDVVVPPAEEVIDSVPT